VFCQSDSLFINSSNRKGHVYLFHHFVPVVLVFVIVL